MDERVNETAAVKNATTTDRQSDRELVVRRTFNGPARHVFAAWTKHELMMRWWAPKSFGINLLSVQTDVRKGGTYRLEFGVPGQEQPVAFFGRYLDVVPNERIVWTNEESDEGSISTLTFEEKDGKTLLVLHELYPTREALDEAIESGNVNGFAEQFESLDEVLATL